VEKEQDLDHEIIDLSPVIPFSAVFRENMVQMFFNFVKK